MTSPIDVIVTGTGRSGTSFVAAVLDQCLGVSMATKQKCESLLTPDEFLKMDPYQKYKHLKLLTSPNEVKIPIDNSKHRWQGSWENGEIQLATQQLIDSVLTTEEWLEIFWEIQDNYKYTYHGCKSTWLYLVKRSFWRTVKPRVVINCIRSKTQVLKSKGIWGKDWGEEKYKVYQKAYKESLQYLPGYIELDFSVEREPEYVIEAIKPLLERTENV